MATSKRPMSAKAVGLKYGFRSGLESKIADLLTSLEVPFHYEAVKLKYTQPEKERVYTPDFYIKHRTKPNHPGLFIETKGRWLTEDRQKHIHIRNSNPGQDIRLLFSNANARISKQSATTYAIYCDRKGWLWAHRTIPTAWLEELGYHF